MTLVRTGVQSGASYTGQASGPDARRRVVSTDLADLDVPGTGSDDRPSLYQGGWAYAPSTGEQRRIADDGYTPNAAASAATTLSASAEQVGYLTLARPLAVALPAGAEVEAHLKLPVTDDDRLPGLHTGINRALRALPVRSRTAVLGVSGQYRHDLSATAPWLTEESDFIAAYDAEPSPGAEPAPLPARLRIDGGAPYLVLDWPVSTGRTFAVETWRPRSTWIKSGGTWGYSAVGLIGEADECSGDADLIATVALYFLADALSQLDPRGEVEAWSKIRDRMTEAALPRLRWARTDRRPASVRLPPIELVSRLGTGREGYGRGRRWP